MIVRWHRVSSGAVCVCGHVGGCAVCVFELRLEPRCVCALERLVGFVACARTREPRQCLPQCTQRVRGREPLWPVAVCASARWTAVHATCARQCGGERVGVRVRVSKGACVYRVCLNSCRSRTVLRYRYGLRTVLCTEVNILGSGQRVALPKVRSEDKTLPTRGNPPATVTVDSRQNFRAFAYTQKELSRA